MTCTELHVTKEYWFLRRRIFEHANIVNGNENVGGTLYFQEIFKPSAIKHAITIIMVMRAALKADSFSVHYVPNSYCPSLCMRMWEKCLPVGTLCKTDRPC